jgi:hypothetical protein
MASPRFAWSFGRLGRVKADEVFPQRRGGAEIFKASDFLRASAFTRERSDIQTWLHRLGKSHTKHGQTPFAWPPFDWPNRMFYLKLIVRVCDDGCLQQQAQPCRLGQRLKQVPGWEQILLR